MIGDYDYNGDAIAKVVERRGKKRAAPKQILQA